MLSPYDIHNYLEKTVVYYQKLPVAEKKRFVYRVGQFIFSKSIEGRQGLMVTSEMKILLAATAVQLTFGLQTWDLSYFGYIMIYPADYQNPNTKNYHKGETNMGGFMCFSWKHFLEGIAIPNDKINLGLHEFGHALRFNGVRGNESDYFFTNYFDRWLSCAVIEYQKLRNNEASIFRKYGAVNINEFFSVVVETFFETPQEFRAYFPELFDQTAILLNQYVDGNGYVQLNVREELLNKKNIYLKRNYGHVLSYTARGNGLVIFSVIFFIVGLLSLQGQGYKYPPAYICMAVAAVCWLVFEHRYTRVSFDTEGFELQKGFLLFKNYSHKKIPYSRLISFTGNSESDVNPVYDMTLTHMDMQGSFYEETIRARYDEATFEQLANDLRRNYIRVYMN